MNMMNGYKRKKYVKIICFIGIAILLLGYMCRAVINYFKPPIGRISGAEMDFIKKLSNRIRNLLKTLVVDFRNLFI